MAETRLQQADRWVREEFKDLVGAKLVLVRGAYKEELDELAWDEYHPAIVMLFDNGRSLIVSQDEEGNGPGALILGEWG